VILTTHELAEAERLADQVVIIDRGHTLATGSPADLAAGIADGSIRFTTAAGLDTASLAGALAADFGVGVEVEEEQPGSYRLTAPIGAPAPVVIAALTGWLAHHDLALGDLRTAASLEEAYLAITGSRPEDPPEGPGSPGDGPARSARPRRSRRARRSTRSDR
jgi:ABC-2 type transport system ATP-binding protein